MTSTCSGAIHTASSFKVCTWQRWSRRSLQTEACWRTRQKYLILTSGDGYLLVVIPKEESIGLLIWVLFSTELAKKLTTRCVANM